MASAAGPNPPLPADPPTQAQNKLESVGEALDGQGQAMEMAGGSRTLPEKGEQFSRSLRSGGAMAGPTRQPP